MGCDNTGREQLVAALPAQLDAQGWDLQQAGQEEGTAESNKAVRVELLLAFDFEHWQLQGVELRQCLQQRSQALHAIGG
ncbi:hypothetical protein HaLaN_23990 [Haematococcus lacustris]|uniref:Uncharacterized protein n=1 Tax=Haematococcus lacustris TaxID=44745 RepID=A0A699ZSY8_HAELA|nr:hypothetical protein HaLaN_23990 [Haematococcus lacustris]